MKVLEQSNLVFNKRTKEHEHARLVIETSKGVKYELVEMLDGKVSLTACTFMNSELVVKPVSTTKVTLSQE